MNAPIQDKDVIVLNPLIVNNLLALGYRITRVGKSNQNAERSVFFFANDKGLEECLARLISTRESQTTQKEVHGYDIKKNG
jgi:hypothetical protein